MLHTVNLWKTDISTRGFNPIRRFHEKKARTDVNEIDEEDQKSADGLM